MSAPPATYVPHTSFWVLPRDRLSRPRNPAAGDKRLSPVTQPTAPVPDQPSYQGMFTSRGMFATKTKLKASVAANALHDAVAQWCGAAATESAVPRTDSRISNSQSSAFVFAERPDHAWVISTASRRPIDRSSRPRLEESIRRRDWAHCLTHIYADLSTPSACLA